MGGKKALPADSLGQGLVTCFQALIKHGSKVVVQVPRRHCLSPRKREDGPKTQGVSNNLETLHFTNRTDPGTERALIYSFIQ